MKNGKRYENMVETTQDMDMLTMAILLSVLDAIYKSLGRLITFLDAIYLNKASRKQLPMRDFLTQDLAIPTRKQ